MPSGLSYLNSLDRFISYIGMEGGGGVWLLLLLSCFIGISELNANSVDPDQTPRSAASDLGLHCLPTALLWGTRPIYISVCS